MLLLYNITACCIINYHYQMYENEIVIYKGYIEGLLSLARSSRSYIIWIQTAVTIYHITEFSLFYHGCKFIEKILLNMENLSCESVFIWFYICKKKTNVLGN